MHIFHHLKTHTARFIPAVLLFALCLLLLPCSTAKAEESTTEAADTFYPDDPYLDALWAFDNPGSYTHYYSSFPVSMPSTAGIDMNIWEAWKHYPLPKEETRTVIVAVIDTGIDYQHPDLKDHMWTNPGEIPDNGIDDDGNGYIDDIHGWDFYHNDATICHYVNSGLSYTADPDDNDNHGTHIAGIIAATANNSIGIAGVASNVNVQIMSLKIHGGTTSAGSVANAIKAIHYAEAMGADICNLSWGTTNYNQALELTIRESSMLFVTAAGNNGINNNSTPVFPASLRLNNLISVAYIDCNGILDTSSNYGVSTVDIAAPGKDIYSTLVGTYGYSSGSSMAAPYVTGLAAMIYAYQEQVYPAQVKEMIINTMLPLDSLNGYLINPGIPDAAAAIRSLSLLPADYEAPFLILETSYDKELITLRVASYDSGGSGIRKIRYSYDSKSAEYFQTENNGTAILEEHIQLSKPGYYTFYVEDYAGNYNLYNHYVEDDTTTPELLSSYEVSPDYSSVTIHFSASDLDSGIKTIKYLIGEHDHAAFLAAGELLDASNTEQAFTIASDIPAVTLYVADYRGNSVTQIIYPEIIPATAIYLTATQRTLQIADSFLLKPLLFPWFTTDDVWFISLDSSVAMVNSQGKVTAVSSGETMIQVTSYSGISAYCRIIVPEAEAAALEDITAPEDITTPENETGSPEEAITPTLPPTETTDMP